MNVILDLDKTLRTTDGPEEGQSYCIKEINFFIPKEISVNISSAFVNLIDDNDSLVALEMQCRYENKNYCVYKVIKICEDIPEGVYKIKLFINNQCTFFETDTIDNISLMEEKSECEEEVFTNELTIIDRDITGKLPQPIIEGDINSDQITFTLNRYYDNEDLSSKICFFKVLGPKYNRFICEISKEQVQIGEDKIIVTWFLNENCTKNPGVYYYSLCFGQTENGYLWQSNVSSFEVEETLNINISGIKDSKKDLLLWIEETKDSSISNTMKDEHEIILIGEKDININNIHQVIEGDNKSQLITFKINRFYNNIDLSDKIITIKYINCEKENYRDRAINVIVDDEYITFSWLITYKVVKKYGQILFAIEIIDEKIDFIWQTRVNILEVDPGLLINIPTENYPDWYVEILNNKDKDIVTPPVEGGDGKEEEVTPPDENNKV